MRMWRTMFSISTIASSTSTPATSDSASRLMEFSVKPIHCMKAKVGIADSGMAERRDQRRARVAQEQPHHQHRQHRAFEQRARCDEW